MTTDQKHDALHETADRAAEHAFRALSNVARALADNTITPAELPAIIVWLDSVAGLVSTAKDLAVELSNRSSWIERVEKEKAS